jgi:alkyl sulfatase BDS1-like metallo-beta-lactamase superfamily hydrolase
LGRRINIGSATESGLLMPTNTFKGSKTLDFGGFILRLVEAPGETHDQLFVWVPADRTLVAGDNFYWTFPNLYTIRGASPRPVNAWINSLDKMRRLRPKHLIPNHTKPIHGQEAINQALTNYRDAIQWVRDAVVRGANQGLDVDTLAQSIKLPPHLAKYHYNKELYGQIDWSVRAIYGNNLGWFDGRADKLYPVPASQAAAREIELMGGVDKVLSLAEEARAKGEVRWAVHLLAKLRTSGLVKERTELKKSLARAYEALAAGVFNTNGRGYLLERAIELRHGLPSPRKVKLLPAMVRAIPLSHIFRIMPTKLVPAEAMDVKECVVFNFPDEKKRFFLTVRRGVCEVSEDQPLPGTPEPLGSITMDANDYRRMALKLEGPISLYAKGKISVDGKWLKVVAFLRRFDMG